MRLAAYSLFVLVTVQCYSATSPGGGYLKLELQPGIQFIGFALQSELALQADYEPTPGEPMRVQFTDDRLPLVNDQFNQHTIEILTPTGRAGWMADVVDTFASTKQLSLSDTLPGDLGSGGSVRIWKRWTLADLFGPTNSAGLTSGATLADSDVLLIPSSTGSYESYYYAAAGVNGTGWRKEGAGAVDQANTLVPLTGGMAIRARVAHTILLIGTLKPGPSLIRLKTGRNLVANLCAVAGGRTLADSGLNALASGASLDTADAVQLWNGSGYVPYFQSTGGFQGVGWRQAGGDASDKGATPLPDGAYIIDRRGDPLEIVLQQGEVGP